MFPTMIKPEKSINLLKVTALFIWSPVAIASGRVREWGKKLANVTKEHVSQIFTAWVTQTDIQLQWWLFNNKVNNSHDSILLFVLIKKLPVTCAFNWKYLSNVTISYSLCIVLFYFDYSFCAIKKLFMVNLLQFTPTFIKYSLQLRSHTTAINTGSFNFRLNNWLLHLDVWPSLCRMQIQYVQSLFAYSSAEWG